MGANVLFCSLCTLTVVTLSNRHDSSADCACFNCSFGVEDCLGPKFSNEPGSALSAWSVPVSPFSQRLFTDRKAVHGQKELFSAQIVTFLLSQIFLHLRSLGGSARAFFDSPPNRRCLFLIPFSSSEDKEHQAQGSYRRKETAQHCPTRRRPDRSIFSMHSPFLYLCPFIDPDVAMDRSISLSTYVRA